MSLCLRKKIIIFARLSRDMFSSFFIEDTIYIREKEIIFIIIICFISEIQSKYSLYNLIIA